MEVDLWVFGDGPFRHQLDFSKVSFSRLPEWLLRRHEGLPDFDALLIKFRGPNNGEAEEATDEGRWERCAVHARALRRAGQPIEILVELKPREESVLSRKMGIGRVSRRWERTGREFVKYSSRLTLEADKVAHVEVTAALMQDLFQADTEDETFARLALTGVIPSLSITRIPINLILIIDRSASMKGPGLEAAKAAAIQAARSVQAGDQLTVIAFDSSAVQVVPTFTKGAEEGKTKEAEDAVRKLEAGGSTNMQNALLMAAAGAREAFSASRTNRVMLLTDGKPTKIDGLVEVVSELSKLGIVTTTLGVGDDFDEQLLAKLAQIGMGNTYWVKNGDNMIEVMKSEIAELGLIVGRNCRVTVAPAPGVSVVEVYGFTSGIVATGETVVEIGDIISNSTVDVLMRLAYNNLPEGKDQKLLDAKVEYLDVNTKAVTASSTMSASFTKSTSEMAASLPVGIVVDKIARVHAAQAMRIAMNKLRDGDLKGALAALSMESAELIISKAAAGASSSAREKAKASLKDEVDFYRNQASRGQLDASALRKELAIRVNKLEKKM